MTDNRRLYMGDGGRYIDFAVTTLSLVAHPSGCSPSKYHVFYIK